MSDTSPDGTAVMKTYREIEAALTAPGAAFELVNLEVDGDVFPVYRNAADNLYDMLSVHDADHADVVMIADDDRVMTYGAVHEAARRFAGGLAQRYGVGPGTRVGIMMANRAAYVVALIAITRLGAVAVLYNSRATPTEARQAMEDVPSEVVVADGKRAGLLVLIDNAPPLIVGDPDESEAPVMWDLIRWSPEGPHRRVAPDNTCLILFTSGTSGSAKGAMLTHRCITSVVKNMEFVAETNLEFASRNYGIPVDDLRAYSPRLSTLLVYPLFHVSGIASIMTVMNSGGVIVPMPRWERVYRRRRRTQRLPGHLGPDVADHAGAGDHRRRRRSGNRTDRRTSIEGRHGDHRIPECSRGNRAELRRNLVPNR
ncbi:AMP-binding protein [Gordonia rhizosphera]|uniref:Putative fatty-acid--CoA ligase n=1 Tax=Gordonia rhizosphera NBRC 16068 TaxID=1108045 RepID=K6X1J4_9ACTN|nr:putative fatty-acid--CoA ligase [Gordonia rhizosphera NBRC 16068]